MSVRELPSNNKTDEKYKNPLLEKGLAPDKIGKSNGVFWTPRMTRRLIDMWQSGYSTRKIARELHQRFESECKGLSEEAVLNKVRRKLNKLGLWRRQKLKWTEDLKRELRRLVESGVSLAEIAAKFGTSYSAIQYAVSRYCSDLRPLRHKRTKWKVFEDWVFFLFHSKLEHLDIIDGRMCDVIGKRQIDGWFLTKYPEKTLWVINAKYLTTQKIKRHEIEQVKDEARVVQSYYGITDARIIPMLVVPYANFKQEEDGVLIVGVEDELPLRYLTRNNNGGNK
ncbi:MAG: hypothetical protein ACP6IU_15050 [Candidatus Asgardarchaeia archaeon]